MTNDNAATAPGGSVTVTVTCTELKTIVFNSAPLYVATMQYANYQGVNALTVNSTSAFKFTVGQTYTMSIG